MSEIAAQRVKPNFRNLWHSALWTRRASARYSHDALQSELEGQGLLGGIPTDQDAVSLHATKTVSPLLGDASYRGAVKHLLTSVVREICVLRLVGAGARATALGHPVGDQARPGNRLELAVPALLTLAVAVWGIRVPSYWRDEAATISAVRRPLPALVVFFARPGAREQRRQPTRNAIFNFGCSPFLPVPVCARIGNRTE